MQSETRARLYRRKRRASQLAHQLHQEEVLRLGSDRDLELKSISCEPTTKQEVEEEEEQDDDDDEEEEEEEKGDDEDEEEEEDDHELAPESSMEEEKKKFAIYRRNWEFTFTQGQNIPVDVFTSLSPMVFTHCTPSCIPAVSVLAPTLQVCFIKVAKIRHLEWPIEVYGQVSARDFVDHKRNLLFYRPRKRSQTLTKNDPYLHLTGPRRGILSINPVTIEITLVVKQGQSWSEDRALVTQACRYNSPSKCDLFYSYLCNYLCKLELCFEQLTRSRQATVLSVRATRGSPFRYGGQVLCCASPYEEDPCKRIVLFDSKYGVMDSDGTMRMDPDGYLDLSRRVVSVQGRLKIFINTYSRSGAILATSRVLFRAKDCQTSQAKCLLHSRHKASEGNAASKGKDEVKITVAWSRFARQISAIELDCFGSH